VDKAPPRGCNRLRARRLLAHLTSRRRPLRVVGCSERRPSLPSDRAHRCGRLQSATVECRYGCSPWVTGITERLFFTVAVAFELSGVATAMMGWMAIKLAANWNRPTVPPGKDGALDATATRRPPHGRDRRVRGHQSPVHHERREERARPHVRVRRVDNAEVTMMRTDGAHEHISVKRPTAEGSKG